MKEERRAIEHEMAKLDIIESLSGNIDDNDKRDNVMRRAHDIRRELQLAHLSCAIAEVIDASVSHPACREDVNHALEKLILMIAGTCKIQEMNRIEENVKYLLSTGGTIMLSDGERALVRPEGKDEQVWIPSASIVNDTDDFDTEIRYYV